MPRVLFLADRNVLADQAKGSFGQFSDNMLQKIKPGAILLLLMGVSSLEYFKL